MTELPPDRNADEVRRRVIWFEDQDGARSLRMMYLSPGDSVTVLGRFAAADVRSPAGHGPRAA